MGHQTHLVRPENLRYSVLLLLETFCSMLVGCHQNMQNSYITSALVVHKIVCTSLHLYLDYPNSDPQQSLPVSWKQPPNSFSWLQPCLLPIHFHTAGRVIFLNTHLIMLLPCLIHFCGSPVPAGYNVSKCMHCAQKTWPLLTNSVPSLPPHPCPLPSVHAALL